MINATFFTISLDEIFLECILASLLDIFSEKNISTLYFDLNNSGSFFELSFRTNRKPKTANAIVLVTTDTNTLPLCLPTFLNPSIIKKTLLILRNNLQL